MAEHKQSVKLTKAKSAFSKEQEYNVRLINGIDEQAKHIESLGVDYEKELLDIQIRYLETLKGRLIRSDQRLLMYRGRYEEAMLAEVFGLNK